MSGKSTQDEIISSKLGSHLLVEARPGTGKTFTLIHRVCYLLGQTNCTHLDGSNGFQMLAPYEIQILSFSRAAVQTIQNRILNCASSQVLISTFDSFVGQILYRIGSLPVNHSYDASIEHFLELLKAGDDEVLDELYDIQYLIVDEAQDLVGNRLKLVMELMRIMPEGSMIFSDPNQAIYDFTVDDDQLHSGEIKKFPNLEIRELDAKNYRLSEELQEMELQVRNFVDRITGYKNMVRTLQSHDNLLLPELLIHQVPTVILAKNTDLLDVVFQNLTEQGFYPTILPPRSDPALPSWLGLCFFDFEESTLSFDNFQQRCYERLDQISEQNISSYWEMLVNSLKLTGKGLNDDDKIVWDDLLTSLQSPKAGDIFEEEHRNHQVILSSIHRAKGREFDDVILAIPETAPLDKEDTRVLYVGLTRASKILKTHFINNRYSSYLPDIGRWFYTTRGGTPAISVGNMSDYTYNSMFTQVESQQEFMQRQMHISQLRVGEDITIRFNWDIEGWEATLPSAAGQSKLPLLRLSDLFTQDIRTVCRKKFKKMPGFINGAKITRIVTEVLPPDSPEKRYCPSGIFLSIRIGGSRCYFGGTNY